MKKIIFLIGLIIVSLFVGGCVEEEITQEPLEFKELEQLEKDYRECYDELSLFLSSEKYQEAIDRMLDCRKKLKKIIREIDSLLSQPDIDKETTEMFEVYSLIYQSDDNYLNYKYLAIKNFLVESNEDVDIVTFIDTYKTVMKPLDAALFNLYDIETLYPEEYYYEFGIGEAIAEIANEYKEINQMINKFYDEITEDPNYKYFAQVDPNNPVIVKLTDEVIEGLTDEKEMALELLNFVKDNVQYKHDPDWMTDWVFPPTLTLLAGKGDCDDMSVLLASLMIRAGVSDVKLCAADTDGDGYEDHLTVVVDNILYDATGLDVEEIQGDIVCASPQEYLLT